MRGMGTGDFHTFFHTGIENPCNIKMKLICELGSSPVSRTNGKSLAMQGFFFVYKGFLDFLESKNDMRISKFDAKNITVFTRFSHGCSHGVDIQDNFDRYSARISVKDAFLSCMMWP
jgi:hypothetical protein